MRSINLFHWLFCSLLIHYVLLTRYDFGWFVQQQPDDDRIYDLNSASKAYGVFEYKTGTLALCQLAHRWGN